MSVDVSAAGDDAAIAACLELRRIVFIAEQGVSEAEERDGRDDAALHLLARVDEEPAGTLRIRVVDGIGKIERVCVLKPHRGSGIGAALTVAALDHLRAQPGVSGAKLGAQVQVIGFYEALGFRVAGPEYLDAGIPHRDMVRAL